MAPYIPESWEKMEDYGQIALVAAWSMFGITTFFVMLRACILSIYKLSIYPRLLNHLRFDQSRKPPPRSQPSPSCARLLTSQLGSQTPPPFKKIDTLSEGCILLVCTSIPTLGPLFRKAKRGSASHSVPTPEDLIYEKSRKLEAQWRPSGSNTQTRDSNPGRLSEGTDELLSSSVPYSSTMGRRDIRKTILIEQSISRS